MQINMLLCVVCGLWGLLVSWGASRVIPEDSHLEARALSHSALPSLFLDVRSSPHQALLSF